MWKKLTGKTRTLGECFEKYGIPFNRKYWSGRNLVGDTVVLSLQESQFKGDKYKTDPPGDWCKEFGNRQRIANLKIVRDHLGGMFTGFIRSASGKVVGECMMRLTSLNEKNGTFTAEVVEQ